MKTHDLAKLLNALAEALRLGPNVELESLGQILAGSQEAIARREMKVGITHLLALSKFDKAQWRTLIEEYKFPIEIKSTYSTRDVVGKVLGYLEKNEAARERLAKDSGAKASNASPELMRALESLLQKS